MAALTGKHALVTGGGSGIGAVVATTLAEAGATVTVTGRRRPPLDALAKSHPRIRVAVADVTDEAALAAAFHESIEAAGPISIVIANAGQAAASPFDRTSLEAFDRLIAVNLKGAFLTLREGVRAVRGTRWGRLIVIASVAGLKGYAYVAPYCAAKHGAVGLVRGVAAELAGSGTTVNAVCPGYTETPMLEEAVEKIVATTGRSDAEARSILASNSPMKRFIKPEEVAATVLWLCGPGSDAVNGQAIAVCGGEI